MSQSNLAATPNADQISEDPASEALRLEALHRYAVLDSLPEESFDRIAQVASRQFKAPISIISLLDEERSWIKAAVGIGIAQTARANGFSSVVIEQDSVLITPDAQADPRFDENILVTGPTRLRFYAGAPIKSAEGQNIGVLSIGDVAPRDTFSDSEQQLLLDLADIVSGALEARVVAQRTLTNLKPHVDSALEQNRRFVESLRDGILSCDQNGVLSVMNSTAREMYGLESAPQPSTNWLAEWRCGSQMALHQSSLKAHLFCGLYAAKWLIRNSSFLPAPAIPASSALTRGLCLTGMAMASVRYPRSKTSRNSGAWKNTSSKLRRWKPLGNSPAALPMISTICWRSLWAICS